MRTFNFRESQQYTIKTLITTTDDLGGQIETWSGTDTIMAEIQPLSGNQVRNEMGVTEKSTHKAFTLGAIKSNTRLVGADGVTYLVGYVADWGSHKEAVLEYVEG